MPESRWTLGQTWEHVFFAHWPVPIADVRVRVPDELKVEEYDGSAWISIVCFRARALRVRGVLPVPGISSFLELNVRTYVRGADGMPGVWFFSLDASSRLAAIGVRRVYHVPAFHARMTPRAGRRVARGRVRRGSASGAGSSAGATEPRARRSHAEPGSLEFVPHRALLPLRRRARRAEMHHDRWLLSPAEAEVELASIAPFGLGRAALCHFAFRQDALIWPLAPIAS